MKGFCSWKLNRNNFNALGARNGGFESLTPDYPAWDGKRSLFSVIL